MPTNTFSSPFPQDKWLDKYKELEGKHKEALQLLKEIVEYSREHLQTGPYGSELQERAEELLANQGDKHAN